VPLFSHRELRVCFRCVDWLVLQRDRRLEGRGGGWTVLGAEPVLLVRDVGRSVSHYERLGFTVERQAPTAAVVTHDRSLRLHLSETEWPGRAGHGAVHLVVPDADEVARAWRAAGVEVVGPEDVDGFFEGAHTDPDGNVIHVRAVAPSPSA
ncbi:MAG TPA: VOC family protein, partial [Acidimicrobiales bacterium]|nr:VOC family protein [Acidimicrobiales bacterium]